MISSEKNLVKGLNCDELCALKHKKDFNKALENKKLKKLADGQLQEKQCLACFQ